MKYIFFYTITILSVIDCYAQLPDCNVKLFKESERIIKRDMGDCRYEDIKDTLQVLFEFTFSREGIMQQCSIIKTNLNSNCVEIKLTEELEKTSLHCLFEQSKLLDPREDKIRIRINFKPKFLDY